MDQRSEESFYSRAESLPRRTTDAADGHQVWWSTCNNPNQCPCVSHKCVCCTGATSVRHGRVMLTLCRVNSARVSFSVFNLFGRTCHSVHRKTTTSAAQHSTVCRDGKFSMAPIPPGEVPHGKLVSTFLGLKMSLHFKHSFLTPRIVTRNHICIT